MVTTDKSRFNRRRMYLISNEFTLSALSGAWPLLIAEGFISLKRDLRELNIAEIPVEPRVRSNLIPGCARAGGTRLSPWFLSPSLFHCPPPSFGIIRNNSSYLASVSARYPYVHKYGRAVNEATEEMSRRAWQFSRILKRYQLFVPGRRAAGERR